MVVTLTRVSLHRLLDTYTDIGESVLASMSRCTWDNVLGLDLIDQLHYEMCETLATDLEVHLTRLRGVTRLLP